MSFAAGRQTKAFHFLSVTSSWLKWKVTAADFWNGARMHGGHYGPGKPADTTYSTRLDLVRPSAVWNGAVDATWIGRQVTLAGLGLTENGIRGVRRFVDEPITLVTDDFIEVDGQGRHGACGGDSGGPLLARDPEAANPQMLGVPSVGDSSCVGRDRYERVDVMADWIRRVMEVVSDSSDSPACRDPTGSSKG